MEVELWLTFDRMEGLGRKLRLTWMLRLVGRARFFGPALLVWAYMVVTVEGSSERAWSGTIHGFEPGTWSPRSRLRSM